MVVPLKWITGLIWRSMCLWSALLLSVLFVKSVFQLDANFLWFPFPIAQACKRCLFCESLPTETCLTVIEGSLHHILQSIYGFCLSSANYHSTSSHKFHHVTHLMQLLKRMRPFFALLIWLLAFVFFLSNSDWISNCDVSLVFIGQLPASRGAAWEMLYWLIKAFKNSYSPWEHVFSEVATPRCVLTCCLACGGTCSCFSSVNLISLLWTNRKWSHSISCQFSAVEQWWWVPSSSTSPVTMPENSAPRQLCNDGLTM